MVEITLDNIVPSAAPTDGWIVKYRIKGSTGAFITATGSPFSAFPIVFNTTDPAGTLYEVNIQNDCDYAQSTVFTGTTPCECVGSGYTPVVDGSKCGKTTTIGATVTNSGYCLASSTNSAYSNYGARIYNTGFTLSTILLNQGTPDTHIYGSMNNNPQWANPAVNTTSGPMNREGVWIDSDCDGNKDALGSGVQTTISAVYNNIGAARTVFIGVGADNQFKIVFNGAVVVDTGTSGGVNQFKIWHLIPVTLNVGANYFNLIATGDGSINDSMAMVIYDNTAAQLLASTSDSSLSILFKSSNLRGTTFDVATCPSGYSLDSSGGSGSYVCVKTEFKICNSIS